MIFNQKSLLMVAGMATAALVLGFVLLTAISANTAYAQADARGIEKKDIRPAIPLKVDAGSENIKKGETQTGNNTDQQTIPKVKTPSGQVITKNIKKNVREAGTTQEPPYKISLSDAEAIVKKAFPDSKINSGGRKSITIVLHDRAGSEAREMYTTHTWPAYVFEMTKTDNKAIYQITVVVNGTSGQIIPPDQFLNNDGMCGPHSHPPGTGTHWHVCSAGNVWRWDPPPTAKTVNPDKRGTLTGIPAVDPGVGLKEKSKPNDGDSPDRTEGKPIEEQVTIKQKSSNVKQQ